MKKIFYLFLSRPVTTAMLFFTVIVIGLISLFTIPVELSPEVEYPKLSVTVYWQGVSPEIMEAQVTSVIESKLAVLKGIKKILSHSYQSTSNIDLEFHPETDMDFARIEINEALQTIKNDLPIGITKPQVSPYIPSDMEELQGFITFTVSAVRSANEIRKFVKERFIYPLLAIDGISDVEVRGGNERLIRIIIDYEKAQAFKVTNDEINNAISNAEIIKTIGNIERTESGIILKVENKIVKVSELEKIAIKETALGNNILLKDIGRVIDDYREQNSYYRINGKETVSIIISKEPGANALAIAETIEKVVGKLRTELPSDYDIVKEIDKSETIRNELGELTSSSIYSLIIILVLLLLIFRKVSISLIIISSIIFSVFFALMLFFIIGTSINILTIAAFILGFGFMLDNSVVVIDYIDKHYNRQGIKYLTVLLKNIYLPVFSATLTTIAVFIPLIFLTGELKLYFQQLAIGVASTLSASLVISFTIVPLMYIKFVENNTIKKIKNNKIIFNFYSFCLKGIYRYKKISWMFLLVLVGIPVWQLPETIETPYLAPAYNSVFSSKWYSEAKSYIEYFLGGSLNLFFNHIDRGKVWDYGNETFINIDISLPNGNKVERINNLTKAFEKEILPFQKNLKNLIANVYDEQNANIQVYFKENKNDLSLPYRLKNFLIGYATRIGGAEISVWGFGPGFSSGSSQTSSFIVDLKGYNYQKVKEISENFRDLIKNNPRIDRVDIDKSPYYWDKDVIDVIGTINRSKLDYYNISLKSVFENISKSTEGNFNWNKFTINNDEVEYNIKYNNYNDVQLDKLNSLIFESPSGQQIKTKDIITFEEKKVLPSIKREDQQYLRIVSFDFKGPYEFGEKFVDASIAKMKIPEGYSIKKRAYNFSFSEEEEYDIWSILGIAILLIFMITAGLFESLKKPVIILSVIPFSAIGTILLFYFGEYTMDRGAYAGILLLIGLSVNNSILLVDYISNNLATRAGFNEIIELSYTRLRAIFTTTFTTIAALIPFLLSDDSRFWKSLSLSIAGGIFFSALFVSLFVPVIYSYWFLPKSKDKVFKD
ncbi:MAG: efflux RND transporter permease subunit [Ignavibacteria bacterium]|nr:efflux RND transporter permease subunit [Ignavibacteria bacterium]